MDTIDVSNLNRQFLFRARHVGQPKASVAATAAAALAPEDVEVFVGSGDNGNGGGSVKEASTTPTAAAAAAATATVGTRIPKAQITPHRGDVRSPDYGVSFFQKFDLVLNGLDNVAARRHVNRLALAARVPLVESGTAGHLGQVTVHFKGLRDGLTLSQQRGEEDEREQQQQEQQKTEGEKGGGALPPPPSSLLSTECYECSAKPAPKSFPVCTIRSTPEKPIHCVVWAKELMFARLLGPPDAVSDLEKGGGGGGEDGGEEGGGGGEEEEEQKTATKNSNKPSLLRAEGESVPSYCSRVYSRLFDSDVREAAALDELWESRPRPAPLPLEALLLAGGSDAAAASSPSSSSSLAAAVEAIERTVVEKASHASTSFNPASFSAARALGLANDHARWPVSSWARLFLGALAGFHALRASDVGAAAFDKDDRLGCELVCAGAALRAAAFRIGGGNGGGGGGESSGEIPPPPPITVFEAKGMAGNIVHALATTNAVVAGLIVAEALKLVAGCPSSCKVTWIRAVGGGDGGSGASGGRLLVAGAPPPPAAGCAVCGRARLELECDPASFTLAELVGDVLKGRLALIAPTLICSSTEGGGNGGGGGGGGTFYWEDPQPANGGGECDLDEDEVEQYSRLLPSALAALPGGGLGAGAVVAVKDQAQAIDLHLLIVQKKEKEKKEEEDEEEGGGGEGEGGGRKTGRDEEEARFVLRGAAPVAAAAAAAAEEGKEKASSPSSSSDLEILPEAATGKEEVAWGGGAEPEVPDAVDAAEALAAEEARKGKEEAAAAVAAATAATEQEQPAAAAEEKQQEEKQQPSSPDEPPSSKRPRRAAAEKGRETVREALRGNNAARGGGGGGGRGGGGGGKKKRTK